MPYTNAQEHSHLDDLTSVSTYLGLSTTTPTKAGANITEPGDTYALVEVPAGSWGAAGATTTGAVKNSAAISFAVATASWGTITHVVLYDDAVGTNIIGYGALTVSKAVTTDQYLNFAIGELTIYFVQP